MKSNYKKLGNYIEACDCLNTSGEITLLQGISNEKYFQECKSNKNGIDLCRYRICEKGWFAYNRATTRNGEKISIAYREEETCIVSPSYKCFRIIDEQKLDPKYLLLWFNRNEFDRYARYKSHGSAHEYFEFNEMCDVEIPVPPIEKQRSIVKAYKTITDRITLKKRINDNLEAQASAIYHSLFDECSEWVKGSVSDFGEVIGGATPSKDIDDYFCPDGIVWLTPKDLTSTGKKFIYKGETDITDAAYRSCSTKLMPKGSVLLTSRAPVGCVAITMTELCTNQGFKSIVPSKKIGTAFVYYFLKENRQLLESHSSGTTFMEISGNVLKEIPVSIPTEELTQKFADLCEPIFKHQEQTEAEIDHLLELQRTMVSQISSR